MDSTATNPEIRAILLDSIAKKPEYAALARCLPALDLRFAGQTLQVTFKYGYYDEFFKKNFQKDFEALILDCFGTQLVFDYAANPEAGATAVPVTAPTQTDPFATFIENSKNNAALAAAKKICASAGPGMLIFSGPSGSGKSCLLSAIANAMSQTLGQAAVYFCRAQAFNPKMQPEEFWRLPRAVIIDDLQEIANDPKSQRLLCAYMDCARINRNSRMVFALGTPPALFDSRLERRLEACLIIDLPPPDLALRIAYAERASHELGLNLQRTQILAIARHTSKISAVAGLLQKLKFYASFSDSSITPAELEKLAVPENSATGWQRVIMQVAERLGIKSADMLGPCRKHELARARQVAMFLCRVRLGLSYPELGRIFGGRDHSTIIHGIRKIQQLRQTDRFLHKIITELENGPD